jgi:hypothetical protein
MNILLGAAIILGACVATCAVMFAVHRLGKRDVLLVDTTRGAGVYAVVGTSFAVLLAFVVLIAFQSHNDARAGARAEADAVLEQFRTAEFFPRGERGRLQGQLICYGRAVAEQEWPAMREGGQSPVVDRSSDLLQQSFHGLRVRTPRETAAFNALLELRNARIDARRERLAEATPEVTAPVWFILLLGAAVNIAFVLVFIDRRDEAFTVQAGLMASVTTIVVAGLLLVWFLDHPYEDEPGGIKPSEMRRSVAVMEDEQPGVAAPWCTPGGDPRPA